MRKPTALMAVLAAGVLLLGGCASLQRSRDEGSMERISALINEGRAEQLAAMSALPFLLDQEIVVLRRDVDSFWAAAIEAGYRIEEPALESGEKIGPESYSQFYDSFEVRTYFKKYLSKNTRMLTLLTNTGQRVSLLVALAPGGRTIHGFKGPY